MSLKNDFVRDTEVNYGVCEQMSPLIRRVVAKNPSPFTFLGTGTYIVGRGNVAVIDPGPADENHVQAILEATREENISHIFITHTHLDHSPACALLQKFCSAPSYAFGKHGAGRKASGTHFPDRVEEGADTDFAPDQLLAQGDIVQSGNWSIECVHTPGHTSNHMCYQLREEKALFTGDHVMGWSTSIISPPDGDMHAYMNSLKLLLTRDDAVYWPTHGSSIKNPKQHVESFIAHRQERQNQILDCIKKGVNSIHDMVPLMYTDTPEFMHSAAARSVFAAIVYMLEIDLLETSEPASLTSTYRIRS